MPDGQDRSAKAGETRWLAAGKHLPENLSGRPFALILVELKGKTRETK